MNSFFQKYQIEGNVPEDNEIQQSRMAAVQGLVEQGITDPEQVMNYLNYDEEGTEVGDFTMDEVQQLLEQAMNQELPEYLSPYQEGQEEEEQQETEEEEMPEEQEEEEMKMGGTYFRKLAFGGVGENPMNISNPAMGAVGTWGKEAYKDAVKRGDYGDFKKVPNHPNYFSRDNEYFKFQPSENQSVHSWYGMYSAPNPNMPAPAPAVNTTNTTNVDTKLKDTNWLPTGNDSFRIANYYQKMADRGDIHLKEVYDPVTKRTNTMYRKVPSTIKMYGGNAPMNSYPNIKKKFKKGGNTYGHGTDSYLKDMQEGFMTGMNELVTNAKIQNQLKQMGMPNNALKMGGSKPEYQYNGIVGGARNIWSGNYPYGYGYPEHPYNPQLGWEELGMNMDRRGATPADIFAAFPGLGESFAQGKNKRMSFNRSMFGLGPVKSGYVEWDGGYEPGTTTPSQGQSAYYDFSGRGNPRMQNRLNEMGQSFKKGLGMVGEELAKRLNLKGYQKTTPKMGDIKDVNTRPIMTSLGRMFDPLRADLGARRLAVKQQSKKHGGSHFQKFQIDGQNQPYAYDPSQDDAYAESYVPPVNTGYDWLGIGEASGDLSDPNRQIIDPAGPLGEETEPFPQKNRYRAHWKLEDPEGDVRRRLGQMAKWTQRLGAQDAARKNQYNINTSTAHNAGFGYVPQGTSGSKGSYTANTTSEDFRPNEYTPTFFSDENVRTPQRLGRRFQGYNMFAQTGGQSFSNMDDYESDYEVGSEHYLSDDEIARIEEMGGQVQIID